AAIAGAALLVGAGVASADPGHGRGPYGHAPAYDYYDSHGVPDYDVDGDGYLSPPERAPQRADRDHDGRLDPRERRHLERLLVRQQPRWGYGDPWGAPGRDPRHLAEHDLNRDGVLDRREMRDLRRHDRIEQLFYTFDRNGDRRLSYWEIDRTPLIATFRYADHDGDGNVTFAELDHYIEAPEQHRVRPRPRPRPGWSWSGSWSLGF